MTRHQHEYDGLLPGEVIRRRREEMGLTQRELAEKVGHIDAAGVSKIETGVTKLGRTRARRFARVLTVSVSLLLPSADQTPTLRSVLDRLESIETDVRLLVDNQERLLALVEHLGEHEPQAGGRGLHSERPQIGSPLSPSE